MTPTFRDFEVTLRLLAKQNLQPVQVVPLRKSRKTFLILAMTLIRFEHLLQGRFELFDGDVGEDLAADRLFISKTSPDKNVITFKRFSRDFHFCSQEADVAHVMLRAGIWTAGQMNVDRLIQF